LPFVNGQQAAVYNHISDVAIGEVSGAHSAELQVAKAAIVAAADLKKKSSHGVRKPS
jgi:hypothetical protein